MYVRDRCRCRWCREANNAYARQAYRRLAEAAFDGPTVEPQDLNQQRSDRNNARRRTWVATRQDGLGVRSIQLQPSGTDLGEETVTASDFEPTTPGSLNDRDRGKAPQRSRFVDEVVVARAVEGHYHGNMTPAERSHAIALLTARGISVRQTAMLLQTSDRTVSRIRARLANDVTLSAAIRSGHQTSEGGAR